MAKHVYAVVKTETKLVNEERSTQIRSEEGDGKMADAKSGSREGGGGEASQTRSGAPGAPETLRLEHNRVPRPAHIENRHRWPAPALL